MTLRDYARKRRFDRTPEPGADAAGGTGTGPIFVVQLHHASHRHYDFRLEIDGALKSWAVPKGPSLRAGEKRLAVEVEDHPLAYATFSGDIPAGQYGAGHVDVFDTGTWTCEGDAAAGHASGKLDFELYGNVLRGRWKLVRTGKPASKPQWLLIKRDDAFAADAESDDFVGRAVPAAARATATATATEHARKSVQRAAPRRTSAARVTRAPAAAPGDALDNGRRSGAGRTPDVRNTERPPRSSGSARTTSMDPRLRGDDGSGDDANTRGNDGNTRGDDEHIRGNHGHIRGNDERTRVARVVPREPARRGAPVNWRAAALALPGARALRKAAFIDVQLATLRTAAPAGDGWLHELKWDGYRMLALVVDAQVALRSRNGLNWSDDFPAVSDALRALGLPQAQFDGELVAFDAAGHVDFASLQRAIKGESAAPMRYVVFDLPLLAGIDLTACRLDARKALLERVLAGHDTGVLAYSRHIVGNGARVFANSQRQHVEGIISKAADAPYAPGRSTTWVKVKHVLADEFVVVGHTQPKGARTGIGALLLATRGDDGALRYVGRVGTGFDTAGLADMARRLMPLVQAQATLALPAHTPLRPREVTWVRPDVVVEVAYRGWGKDGLLRQGSFQRVRSDKPLADVGGDRASPRASPPDAPRPRTPARKTTAARVGRPDLARITSPGKQLYGQTGITKADVAAYYAQVAPLLLPEVVNRPLSLLRCPSGIEGACFFQKHHAATLGANVHAVAIAEKDGGTDEYLFIDDADGLLDLVQMNTLELHPWGSRISDLEHPDRLVFDLDPGPGVGWAAVCDGARTVRERLAEAGLTGFVRLSGGKGLHVVVPIAPTHDWAAAKAFCGAFAQAMATMEPNRFVATASKARRDGVIFIDWLRNGRGATSVCSWSLRARAAAGVAVPLAWEELQATTGGDAYPLARALDRARTHGNTPWDGWARAGRQRLVL